MSKIVHRAPSGSPVLEQKFLTVKEVAAMLRTSNMTVYRLCGSGEIESIKVGRSYRIPEAAAARLAREGTGGVG